MLTAASPDETCFIEISASRQAVRKMARAVMAPRCAAFEAMRFMVQDDQKSTNALAGGPASSFDVSRAAQPETPASAPFDWISEFAIVHTRRDPATLAVIGEERADITEEMFWQIVGLFNDIASERLDRLSRNQKRALCEAIQTGMGAEAALVAVENVARVH